ncbi:DUF3160 domain-containing protein [Fimbriimonas ginsengisoli]|uniref:DUF3160 domain-containing protein n=1 Tax=Fimbriimonas ginsengisoli Gsoil 348 TaxID=661478 RepID=A0A068NMZ9_FIMGI|nr:DUF3160 domain-containing protein [Fimbriimonas ginsengisoli]AIE84938.1 hypothetical protein OP10G_1570 [Fimbriimonas ginsengisoli Gsoil 348]
MNKSNSVLTFAICLAASTTAHAQRAASLSSDLHEISNLAKVRKSVFLKAPHLAALRKNMFFTAPSDDKALYWVYGSNDYREIPSFVTTDNVLQIYHTFFESTLRGVEEKALLPELRKLTHDMVLQAEKTYRAQKGTPLAKPALKNLAYFAVADRLLNDGARAPDTARGLVDLELGKIQGATGRQRSSIFPYDLDYSQFIVRGHYSRTPALKQYFKGMMWYGLVPFSVAQRKGHTVTPLSEQIQQALLLADDLKASKSEGRWRRIYGATALFAGKSDNLTPQEWKAAASRVFKRTSDYGKPALLKTFATAVSKLRPASIVPKLKDGTNPSEVQLRFMGQRAIPDSMILQTLCDPDKRPFPSPLDVMAVLGSPQAKSILDAHPSVYNPKGWRPYRSERNRLQAAFANRSQSDWSRDLYSSWLDSLRATIASPPRNYPKFMRSDAWGKKSLYTALASWAELRHDTILYGKQSNAEMGDGEEPVTVKGYVEPNVAFYRRMLALMHQTAGGLKARGFLSNQVADNFIEANKLIAFLSSVSDKELAGKRLTKDEHNRIRFIEGELESANVEIMKTATGYNTLTEDDLDMALVADVHTAYGKALTVAVGRADHLFAVVPIDGKLFLARGSTLSYFEFLVPSSQRMTDEAWKKQLNAGKIPARPDWTKAFYVPLRVKTKSD